MTLHNTGLPVNTDPCPPATADLLGPVTFEEAQSARPTIPTYRHPLRHSQLVSWSLIAKTPEAQALIEHLTSLVDGHCGPGRSRSKLLAGVGAFVGSLLLGATTGSWSSQPTRTERFSCLPIGAHHFTKIRRTLVNAGLVEELGGFFDPEFGGGACTKFRATPALLRLAQDHGVAGAAAWLHFGWATEKAPEVPGDRAVLLRSRGGDDIALPATAEAEQLIQEVLDFNAFVRGFNVTYGPAHDVQNIGPQFQRIFTEDLQKHGRWYAVGKGYQGLLARLRPTTDPAVYRDYGRHTLRIDDEPCADLDVRASHLTTIHGLAGVPLPSGGDPYAAVPQLPREVAKAWVSARIGLGRAPSSWPDEAVEDLRELHGINADHYPIAKVRRALIDAMPVLGRGLPKVLGVGHDPKLGSHVLMGVEARAVTRAMMALKDQGVLGLPLHDALIIQQRHADAARAALIEGYRAEARITPFIRTKTHEEASTDA